MTGFTVDSRGDRATLQAVRQVVKRGALVFQGVSPVLCPCMTPSFWWTCKDILMEILTTFQVEFTTCALVFALGILSRAAAVWGQRRGTGLFFASQVRPELEVQFLGPSCDAFPLS